MTIHLTTNCSRYWLLLGGLTWACAGAVNDGSSSALRPANTGGVRPVDTSQVPLTGGAPSTVTTGIGGTSTPAAAPPSGGAISSGETTGGQPGCEYQGRWYPAGSFWESGDGCGCTGASTDGGVTVMRVCTEHICYSNGFVSIAGVGTYCVVEGDASVE